MSEEREVWKVLDRDRRSAICGANKYGLCYPINETVSPQIGKIFCFDTFEHADSFRMKEGTRMSVHRAIATNPQRMDAIPSAFVSSYGEPDNIRAFWTRDGAWEDAKNTMGGLNPSPLGTLVCDSIKCLE